MVIRYDLAPLGLPPDPAIHCAGHYVSAEHVEFLQLDRRWAIMYMLHANTVQIKLNSYEVREHDLLCVPPGSRLSWAVTGLDYRYRVITFVLPPEGRPLMAIPHLVADQRHLEASMETAMTRIIETRCAAIAFIWQALWDVAQPRSVIRQQSIMYEAEAFIEENLASPFTVEDMCEALSTDYAGTLRAFRAEHGVSIQHFIVQKRVQEACRLLTTTDASIKEIALRVGYVDLQQFNKMLRRHIGKSPSVVREEYSRLEGWPTVISARAADYELGE